MLNSQRVHRCVAAAVCQKLLFWQCWNVLQWWARLTCRIMGCDFLSQLPGYNLPRLSGALSLTRFVKSHGSEIVCCGTAVPQSLLHPFTFITADSSLRLWSLSGLPPSRVFARVSLKHLKCSSWMFLAFFHIFPLALQCYFSQVVMERASATFPERVNSTSSRWGETALHWAAQKDHCAVVEKLISAGAKVDAADCEGPWAKEVVQKFTGKQWEVCPFRKFEWWWMMYKAFSQDKAANQDFEHCWHGICIYLSTSSKTF